MPLVTNALANKSKIEEIIAGINFYIKSQIVQL